MQSQNETVWRPQSGGGTTEVCFSGALNSGSKGGQCPKPTCLISQSQAATGWEKPRGGDSRQGASGTRKSPPQCPHIPTTTKKHPSSPEACSLSFPKTQNLQRVFKPEILRMNAF